ncbi:MAG: putative nucleotidyltransferase substrate binding domain-containing protein [Candidatus Competibacterales bacterium]|nr:putative nucleotidyltransferase substrate binding domain-containing protein [Candidatus Competibacterales bacterium]
MSNDAAEFIAQCPPFDRLPEPARETLATALDRVTLTVGDTLETGADAYLIRSGAVETELPGGRGSSQPLGEGELFGQQVLLGDTVEPVRVRSLEETVLYRIPGATLRTLCREQPALADQLGATGSSRLRGAIDRMSRNDDGTLSLLTLPLTELMARPPVTLPSTATIQEAARLMADKRISSLLVIDDERLRGVLTDRDLRSRVLARGLPYDRPLSEVMTPDPFTVESSSYGFEALLAMARRNIHHLPVVDNGTVKGMITATDLLERRAASAIYLVSDIHKRESPESLAEVSTLLPRLLVSLIDGNATAHSAGHVISTIGEAITTRLLALAEAELGPPPVPYAWMAAGSLARYEQTALSDQDNGLLLHDDYDPERHGDYFERLARFVCDGLDACGYVYCPGDVMAMNPQWRQPLATWQRYFDRWIEQPDPKALMLSSIFFDLRPLHGDTDLFHRLSTHVLTKSRKNRIFLAYMTANALTHQPPLGFFRNFVLIKDGEHDRTLDLKHNGVVPIIDLARIYALAAGVSPVNTRDRLAEVAGAGELSNQGAADLRDALEFIGTVRLQHQARRIKQGDKADNYVAPKELSHFDRNHLKDAFSLVRTMQNALAQRFQANRLG